MNAPTESLPVHFIDRCRERAPHIRDPEGVAREIIRAVRGEPHGLTVVDVVIPRRADDREGAVWRIGTDDGFVYAVVSERGWPITVLTKDMVRRKKWLRKSRHKRPANASGPRGRAA